MEGSQFVNERENAIEFLTGHQKATVTFSQPRFINRIRKLKEKYPLELDIIADGPENGGYLTANIPTDWIKISPKREMSEEEKERRRELFLANIDKYRDDED